MGSRSRRSRRRTRSPAWSRRSSASSRPPPRRHARGALVGEGEPPPRARIAPLWVKGGIGEPIEISSMPGQFQHTLESLRKEVAETAARGVTAFMLFGVPERKDAQGSEAWSPEGIGQRGLRVMREELGAEHVVMSDLCLDEYTDHGHCGVLDDEGHVDNDRTVELYRTIALAQAEAGAQMVGPSGMMDGQVAAIREALDGNGFERVGIIP